MSRRLLLTGGAGFVGMHSLRRVLLETDWHVVLPVSFKHKGQPNRLAHALGLACSRHDECLGPIDWLDRVDVIHTDLRVPFTDVQLRQIGDIDFIWNIAAESHVDRSISEPVDFIRANVDIATAMGENARRLRPELFLQMSTDEVYGPAARGHSHKEWEPILPSNPYSASKACQEAILFSYWRTYGVPLVITNTMNIIGETQDPEKFVPMVLDRVVGGRTVQIHSQLQEGRKPIIGSRCWLHAQNLADAWLFLTRKMSGTTWPVKMYEQGDPAPWRFHIVGDEMSNLEIAQHVAEYAGEDLDYELVDFHSSRPGHDLRYSLDGSLLRSYGWNPPVSLGDSIKELVRWTLNHPEWLSRD